MDFWFGLTLGFIGGILLTCVLVLIRLREWFDLPDEVNPHLFIKAMGRAWQDYKRRN